MTAPIEVLVCGAADDTLAMKQVADALAAAGVSCAVADTALDMPSRLAALERCRALVLVLSAATERAPHVVREIERAAARAVPTITYAIEHVEASPSIRYFTGTIPPIHAWPGSPADRPLDALVTACRNALRVSPRAEIAAEPAGRFVRATYVASRGRLIGTAILLTIFAVINVLALVGDARVLFGADLETPVATAAEYAESPVTLLGPMGTLWTVLIGSILILQRARQNLVAQFAPNVRISAREIVWRSLMPTANVVWLPRMAQDLWRAAAAHPHESQETWPLVKWWMTALLISFLLAGVREASRTFVTSVFLFAVASAMVESTCLWLSIVTYRILASLDRRVRTRYQAAVGLAAPAAAPRPAIVANVLLAYERPNQAVAARLAERLAASGSRCWSSGDSVGRDRLRTFDAVLVIVSHESHSSPRIVSLVESALSAGVHVVPFVIDPPPDGSALGHLVRTLHWLDGTQGVAALETMRPAAASPAASVTRADVSGPDPTFFQALDSRPPGEAYRPHAIRRRAARGLARVQIVAALIVIALAAAVLASPDGGGDPAGNVSILLTAASLPAWAAFVLWLAGAIRNNRALGMRDTGSRWWALVKVATPGLSLLLGGRTLSRFSRSTGGLLASRGTPPMRYVTLTWTICGAGLIICAIEAWMFWAAGFTRTAMLFSIGQAMATAGRGILRARLVRRISNFQDTEARLWFTQPERESRPITRRSEGVASV